MHRCAAELQKSFSVVGHRETALALTPKPRQRLAENQGLLANVFASAASDLSLAAGDAFGSTTTTALWSGCGASFGPTAELDAASTSFKSDVNRIGANIASWISKRR